MSTPTDLNPAAIMAEHDIFHVCDERWTPGGKCQTYELARDLVEANRKVADLETALAKQSEISVELFDHCKRLEAALHEGDHGRAHERT